MINLDNDNLEKSFPGVECDACPPDAANGRFKIELQATEEPWVPHLRRRPRRLLRERTVLAALRNAPKTDGDEGGAAQPLSFLRLPRAA